MELYNAQITGSVKTSCEDIIYKREDENGFILLALADGQTEKIACRWGGRAACMVAADILQKTNLSMVNGRFRDTLRNQLADAITDSLKVLSETLEIDISQFASTLQVIALNTYTGAFVTLHLGDGRIMGIKSDGRLNDISPPENGITRQYTYLTHKDLMTHLRIQSGNFKGYKALLLSSDGADRAIDDLKQKSYQMDILSMLDDQVLSQALNDYKTADDATILCLKLSDS